jgi:hypothetical protein
MRLLHLCRLSRYGRLASFISVFTFYSSDGLRHLIQALRDGSNIYLSIGTQIVQQYIMNVIDMIKKYIIAAEFRGEIMAAFDTRIAKLINL